MEDGKFLKWFSLLLLTFQNVSLVLLMRYVRTRPGILFSSSTAVVWSEIFKFIICLLILLYTFKFNLKNFFSHLKENIISDPWDWLLISVPAIIYVLQNNLLFVAISNLDAATFQVCYQLKLLTTALFFRILLGKPLSKMQWISLVLLFGGIATVQQQQPAGKSGAAHSQNQSLGLAVVLVASLMSGFGGVYFEKILKNSPKNVWIRNIQLASYGVVFGLITVAFTERHAVVTHGFMHGYDALVWLVIVVQSVGGLLVAVVIKYADNILKGFATTVAIILAAILSMLLFSFQPTMQFIAGASLVVVATILYSKFPHNVEPPKVKPEPSASV